MISKNEGFDGFVMSDFLWGVRDTVEEANGGQDIEMMTTQWFGDRLLKAVQDGFVSEERINDAVLRIVRTILAFDDGHKEYDMSMVGCPEHVAVAKKVAEQGITLVKNRGALPFNRKSVKKLALIGGNTILMTEWFDDVNAVVMAYYPGMEGGNALAEILFGDVNPSGKLPFVVPYGEADLPWVDWEGTDQYYEYYHGYTRLEKNGVKPLIPYGYGLSYTTFAFGTPTVTRTEDGIRVETTVRNTGDRAGAEVCEVYVGFENSSVDRPIKQLKGFKKVSLEAGEEKQIAVEIPLEKLKWYNPVCRAWELEAMEYTIDAGSSSDNADLKTTKISL